MTALLSPTIVRRKQLSSKDLFLPVIRVASSDIGRATTLLPMNERGGCVCKAQANFYIDGVLPHDTKSQKDNPRLDHIFWCLIRLRSREPAGTVFP